MDWFLYDREQLRHEGVKVTFKGYSERLFLEKHIQSNSRLTGACALSKCDMPIRISNFS